ncbi:hypothetical protein QJS10_CPA09g01037 [Acorus calamus]|uniref:RNase H type-1 domain-containing protein n=1 Tax=Acorus calamus TaxID=4465 RepID=A0AAV9E6S0_ACOCL|nr:hypothetical protein QJS10_CPA09g01037 [Acorus calamus]
MWSIWLERNDRLFRQKKCFKPLLVRHILSTTRATFVGQRYEDEITPMTTKMSDLFSFSVKEKQQLEKEVIWEPPQDGWVKLNSDGSKTDDRYAYGALIRDSSADNNLPWKSGRPPSKLPERVKVIPVTPPI